MLMAEGQLMLMMLAFGVECHAIEAADARDAGFWCAWPWGRGS